MAENDTDAKAVDVVKEVGGMFIDEVVDQVCGEGLVELGAHVKKGYHRGHTHTYGMSRCTYSGNYDDGDYATNFLDDWRLKHEYWSNLGPQTIAEYKKFKNALLVIDPFDCFEYGLPTWTGRIKDNKFSRFRAIKSAEEPRTKMIELLCEINAGPECAELVRATDEEIRHLFDEVQKLTNLPVGKHSFKFGGKEYPFETMNQSRAFIPGVIAQKMITTLRPLLQKRLEGVHTKEQAEMAAARAAAEAEEKRLKAIADAEIARIKAEKLAVAAAKAREAAAEFEQRANVDKCLEKFKQLLNPPEVKAA